MHHGCGLVRVVVVWQVLLNPHRVVLSEVNYRGHDPLIRLVSLILAFVCAYHLFLKLVGVPSVHAEEVAHIWLAIRNILGVFVLLASLQRHEFG